MTPQPMIAVKDVKTSSRWYQAVLGLKSGHGGDEYEQLMQGTQMVMQLHHWDTQVGSHSGEQVGSHSGAHEHPHLGNPALPVGNGALLWFQEDNIVTAYERAVKAGAHLLSGLQVNPNAQHREFWLHDPDDYVVVVAGAYGDIT
jgi:catechol 2,3-dioxygenase-like lactoylglutathione lyase family enzyme